MTMTHASDQAEPPLISKWHELYIKTRRFVWIQKKLWAPDVYRALVAGLAGVLLIALNPIASGDAYAAAGPVTATPELASFSFSSYEEVSTTELASEIHEQGFAPKPLVVATEIGRPEKELKERQRREAQRRAAAQRAVAQTQTVSTPNSTTVAPSAGNTYAYGYCTWWAKSKRPDIPNRLGNARTWLSRAQASGLATGSTPQVGAIVATTESAYGHVGYVEAVEGNDIVVSDMNMIGWGKVSKRRMSTNAGVIRGYIY